MNENRPLHILLAEDDDDDTFLFQEALQQIPLLTQLDVAYNGVELVQALTSYETIPDLIFLDMNMPIKNGLECLYEIRHSENFREIPVVMLSTSIASYLLESSRTGGANLYVQKPTSFSDLVSVLKNCLLQREHLLFPADPEQFLIKNDK